MLAGSGLPVTHDEFEWMIKKGVKAIVTVREVPLPLEWVKKLAGYLHVRVEDYGSPSIEELYAAVSFIEENIEKKMPVLVHCAAGKGRTGEVLAAYLMFTDSNLTASGAIQKMRSFRPGSVQSIDQEKALEMFEQHLRVAKDSKLG